MDGVVEGGREGEGTGGGEIQKSDRKGSRHETRVVLCHDPDASFFRILPNFIIL